MPERYHRIRSLEVDAGFLDGRKLVFDDQFTCLIGGRGSGKTTVLEFLRYAIDAMPSNPARRKEIRDLVTANLADGTIRVEFETQDGISYSVERDAFGKPLVRDAQGKPTELTLEHGGFFGVDVYSQNEIERIAKEPAEQLALVDRFRSAELREIERGLQATKARLTTNAAAIVALVSEEENSNLSLGDLPQIEEALKGLRQRQGGRPAEVALEIERKALRDQEARRLAQAQSSFNDLQHRIDALGSDLARRATLDFEDAALRGPNQVLLERLEAEAQKGARLASEGLEKARAALMSAEERLRIHGKDLAKAHEEQDAGYTKLMKQHESDKELARKELELEEARNKLVVEAERHQATQAGLAEQRAERKKILREFDSLRLRRRQVRREIVDTLNERLLPLIRVNLLESEVQEEFRHLLKTHLSGEGRRLKSHIPKIVANLDPRTFGRIVDSGGAEDLEQECDLPRSFSHYVVERLRGTPQLYELESVDIEDGVSIELDDGSGFKPSQILSTGQRCTAILPLLLLESEQPLIVDQPEDNLDNRYIFEVVVKKIEEVKLGRQLIFATHNPNLPVLGEAGQVIVLSANGAHVTDQASGNVDEMRGPIEEILEGGRVAFRLRAQRYGMPIDS